MNEPSPRTITRDSVLGFSPEAYYERLTMNFPILMTCLIATTTKSSSWEEAFQVNVFLRSPLNGS